MWTIHKAEECKLPEPKKYGSKDNGENNSGDKRWKLANALADLQANHDSTVR